MYLRQVTVKAKDKRLPDRHGMSASIPPEMMSDNLRERLVLAGFTKGRAGQEDIGRQVWSLRPTVAALPVHLLRSLEGVVHVIGDENLQNALRAGTQKTGEGKGREELRVRMLGPFFCANCDEQDTRRRSFLEGAGFFPLFPEPPGTAQHPIIALHGNFPYVTQDSIIAINLMPWMDAETKGQLIKRAKEDKERLRRSRAKNRIETDPIIPMAAGEHLQGFQNTGVNNLLLTKKSGVIYDDMGLGKTPQGVGYANVRPDLSLILVVCKANMKQGWAKSFERFGSREYSHFIFDGVSTTQEDKLTKETIAYPAPEIARSHNLFIINYDILAAHEEFIRSMNWNLVILDEIHSVSNEEAIRTRVLFGDLKAANKKPERIPLARGGVIIGLSGTPHPVVERMWPILSGLRPDLFGTGLIAKRAFINRYAPPTLFVKEFSKGNRTWKKILAIPGKLMREAELNRRMAASGFMTRRLKSEMADLLPPKSRAALELPFTLTDEEMKELAQLEGQIERVAETVAERLADGHTRKVREGEARAVIDVVSGLHPKSPEFHEISRLRARIGEIKAPYVARYVIEESEGEEDLPANIRPKTVIFAHHKAVISRIRDEIEKAFPGQSIVYDGSVNSDKKRYELEQRFQTDDRVRFFIMSLSGASGITLTRANRLYMAELDWDPTNLPQIEDRIWRMTQEQPCFIYYFMLVNSLDAQMGNRLMQRMSESRSIYDKVDMSGETRRKAVKPNKKGNKQGELQF